MNHRKWLIGATVIGLGVGAWYLSAGGRGLAVTAGRVTSGPIEEYIEERAETRLPETVRITMPAAGRLTAITLAAGSPVSAGQVVARMDTTELETQLKEARARGRGPQATHRHQPARRH